MKKVTMFKLSAIALALGVAGVANAGTMSATNSTYAAENFKSGGTAITLPKAVAEMPVTYSFTTATTMNANSTIVLTLRLTNGTFTAAPAFGDFKLASVTAIAAANGTTPGAAVALSADKTTAVVTFTSMTGGTTSLGLGAITYTPSVGGITANNAVLGVSGGAITAAAAITTTAPAAGTFEAVNPMPTTIDLPAVSGVAVATSQSAVTLATDAIMGGYAAKIDLTASPINSNYTSAAGVAVAAGGTPVTGAALGSVTFTNAAAPQPLNLAGAAAVYKIGADSAAAAHTATIVVTPGAGQSFPVGAVLYSAIANTCAAQVGPLAAFTAATAATAATLTVPAANLPVGTLPGVGVTMYVCMTAPSAGNVAAPIKPTLVATLKATTAADASPTATGTGYALQYNGQVKTITTYVPAAVAGYTALIRVVNTGAVAAPVSLSVTPEAGGAAVAAATPVVASLAAGATANLSAATIETNLATPANFTATSRPRITISAPTNGMVVQSFVVTPSGALTELSGQAAQ